MWWSFWLAVFFICLIVLITCWAVYRWKGPTPHEWLYGESVYNSLEHPMDRDTKRDDEWWATRSVLVWVYVSPHAVHSKYITVPDLQRFRQRLLRWMSGTQSWTAMVYGLDPRLSNDVLDEVRSWKADNVHLVKPYATTTSNNCRRMDQALSRNALLQATRYYSQTHKKEFDDVLMLDAHMHRGPMCKNGLIRASKQMHDDPQLFGVAAWGTYSLCNGLSYESDCTGEDVDNRPDPVQSTWQSFSWYKWGWSNFSLSREVASAFAGATLYRFDDVVRVDEYPVDKYVCEHDNWHARLHRERFKKVKTKSGFPHMLVLKEWHLWTGSPLFVVKSNNNENCTASTNNNSNESSDWVGEKVERVSDDEPIVLF